MLLFGRRPEEVVAGPAVALCPGPDFYGYTCASGDAFAYIDATHDTQLYQDDGTITLDLPFPFVFYGTTYTSVTASSNGNLQFDTANAAFFNDCLAPDPLPEMGDLIAPYWDDLDLRFFGFLETEVVGEPPDRIFVIEWDDIPRFGENTDDRVTFEVQLFETSHDIVFLYEDVTTFEGNNGQSATIGLQSGAQGLALQYGCNQPVVADAKGIYWPHPTEPNAEVGRETVMAPGVADPGLLYAKGEAVMVAEQLNRGETAVLARLRQHWLTQSPLLTSEWTWADLNGNGRSELILLWHSTIQYPELTHLAVLAADETNKFSVIFQQTLSNRQSLIYTPTIHTTADLTNDTYDDILIHDQTSGQTFVLGYYNNQIQLLTVPDLCTGSIIVRDVDENGRLDIIRDHCTTPGRTTHSWNGTEFAKIENKNQQ